MKELMLEVRAAVTAEYRRAAEKYGPANNSPHESYAVILEEHEEAEECGKAFSEWMTLFWLDVRGNRLRPERLDGLEERAVHAAAEWIQVAAMCRKALQSASKGDSQRQITSNRKKRHCD